MRNGVSRVDRNDRARAPDAMFDWKSKFLLPNFGSIGGAKEEEIRATV